MKKLVLITFLTFIFMASCKKESHDYQPDSGPVKLVTLSDGAGTSFTMLEFISITAFDSIQLNLEEKVNTSEDQFIAENSSLSDSLLNEKEIETGFKYHQPLIEFEKSLNFTNSMRQIFVLEEEDWLNHEDLDEKTDPSLIYVFDIFEMTMLNEDGEMKIGNSLIKLTNEGFVEFKDGDINKLIRFNNGDMSVLDDTNVFTNLNENPPKSDCVSWKGANVWDTYANNKKVNKKVHFHSWPWKGSSEAQITSYRYRNHRWSEYRMSLGVALQSKFYGPGCETLNVSAWSGWKRLPRKNLVKYYNNWGSFQFNRAKNGDSVVGYFEYAGNSNTLVLSW